MSWVPAGSGSEFYQVEYQGVSPVVLVITVYVHVLWKGNRCVCRLEVHDRRNNVGRSREMYMVLKSGAQRRRI
jgi:hypothetical protein